MKVNIEFKDDEELRKEVYNIIEGQVRKIIREEGSAIVKKAVDHELSNIQIQAGRIENIVRSEIQKIINEATFDNIDYYNRNRTNQKAFNNIIAAIRREILECVKNNLITINIKIDRGNMDIEG